MSSEFTTKEAAAILGITDSRIRQLALAGEIEYKYFGRLLVVTREGIEQARKRQTNPGRKRKLKESKAA